MYRRSMFRSTNPVYAKVREEAGTSTNVVTREGVGLKTLFLLVLAIASGIGVAMGMDVNVETGQLALSQLASGLLAGSIVFLLIGMIGSWLSLSPIFPILYSIGYGATLGAFSMIMEVVYPGIVLMAVAGTASIFLGMLSLYNLGIIKVTERFRAVVMGALLGYVFFSLSIWLLSFFMGSGLTQAFFGNNTTGIIIGAVAVILGALMLALDFDAIDQCANNGVDKRYEWRLAFGLSVTILWIYVELLKLIARFMNNRK